MGNQNKQSGYFRSINLSHHLVPFHFTIKNQKSKIKNQKSKTKNQKSKIQNQDKNRDRAKASICPTISSLSISPSKIKNQKSKTKNQKSKIKNQKFKIKIRIGIGRKHQFVPPSRPFPFHHQKSKIKNQKPKIKNHKSKIKNQKSKSK